MAASSQRLSLPASEQSGLDKESSGVATFVAKIWKIVENPDYNHLISWSDNGKKFVVHNYPQFSKEILPLYFKHSNFNSFVRQLNLYGFRKVAKPDQGSLALARTLSDDDVEWWHNNFRRGHPELLHLVQRRTVVARMGVEEKGPQLSKVMSDLHQMKGRQESIASIIEGLQQDNTQLRREVSVLKDKHIRQQKVLNKIIQFLVHMVYKGGLSGRRRSARLMLMDAESQPSPPKRMRTSSNTSTGVNIDDITYEPGPSMIDSSVIPSVQSPPTSPTKLLSTRSNLPSVSSFIAMEAPVLPPSYSFSTSSATPTSFTATSSATPTSVPLTTTVTTPPSPLTTTITTPLSPTVLAAGSSQSIEPLLADTENTLQLPSDLLAEFSLNPPPSSLLANSSLPDSMSYVGGKQGSDRVGCPSLPRMCIHDHLDHQQQGLNALPDLLSGQLSVDPSIISEFISLNSLPVPDYDTVDTARLLESLTNDNSTEIPHESTLQSSAVVPFLSTQFSANTDDDDASSLQELLEHVPSPETDTMTAATF